MNARKTIVLLVATCFGLALSALKPTPALAAEMIYTQTNPAGPNSIAAFQQDPGTGALTLQGLFATGGVGNPNFAGCSQDTIVVDRGFLFAVNTGSNDISVFAIQEDGSLDLIGSPVSSGGLAPITLAISHGILYVANQGDNVTVAPNYTGFFVNEGHLSPIPNSTEQLPLDTFPGDLRFFDNGKLLFASQTGTSALDVFRVTDSGQLERTQELTGQSGAFGMRFNPARAGQLVVGLAGLPGGGVLQVEPNGVVVAVSQAANPPAVDSCWVAIRNDGEFAWLSGLLGQSIVLNRIDQDGSIVVVSTHDTSSFGRFASDIALDHAQRFMYEILPGTGQVHAMRVTGGTENGGLADIQTVALPANSAPQGLVVVTLNDGD